MSLCVRNDMSMCTGKKISVCTNDDMIRSQKVWQCQYRESRPAKT